MSTELIIDPELYTELPLAEKAFVPSHFIEQSGYMMANNCSGGNLIAKEVKIDQNPFIDLTSVAQIVGDCSVCDAVFVWNISGKKWLTGEIYRDIFYNE